MDKLLLYLIRRRDIPSHVRQRRLYQGGSILPGVENTKIGLSGWKAGRPGQHGRMGRRYALEASERSVCSVPHFTN